MVSAIGVAMLCTDAMHHEDRIGAIAMRVEFAERQCDEARRAQRADALMHWLLEEWTRERECKEVA